MTAPRVSLCFLAAIALILLASTLCAQEAVPLAPAVREPTALAAIAQALALMAPSAGATQDAIAQGTYTDADGTTGAITMKCKGKDLMREDLSLNGDERKLIIHRGGGYSVLGGTTRKLPPWATAYAQPEIVPAFSRMAEYALPNTQLLYVRLESVAGRPAHHIRLSAVPTDDTPLQIVELMSEFHLFIDAQTGLLLKTISYDFSFDTVENRVAVETYFDDYRSVGGALIPYHLTRYIAGSKFCEITLASVQLNAGLADSDFQ
jgi:hypothetical protein